MHTDVCGPMKVESADGSKYTLTFTDDLTRLETVYFIKNKSDVLAKFKEYTALMENMSNNYRLQTIRSDNGGEYCSINFKDFCNEEGITHQFSMPYSLQQNGISERINHTLPEKARSMIYHAKMPLNFWAEAVNTAVYLHNCSATTALDNKTPYECWFGKKLEVSNSDAFVIIMSLMSREQS